MLDTSPAGPARASLDTELVARTAVVTALVGSGVIHATVISEHSNEWPLAGWFFLVLTLSELFLALATVLVWSWRTAVAVMVTSVGTVSVWGVSRTVGMPFGPTQFRTPEGIGAPDVACCMLELVSAALVTFWVLRRWCARACFVERPSNAGIAVATALASVLIVVTLWGLLPALTGSAEGEDTHPGHVHGMHAS